MQSVLICLLFVAGASAVCNLNLQNPYPIVAKRIGSKTAFIKGKSPLRLSNNETITLFCPQGLIFTQNYQSNVNINRQSVEIKCGENGAYTDFKNFDESLSSKYIQCSTTGSQTLYESNSKLLGCDMDAMTLIIGYKIKGLSDVKMLAMCYDLAALRLRFVNFLAYPPRNMLLDLSQMEPIQKKLHLDTFIGSLSSYFDFISDSKFQQLITNQSQLGELYDDKLFEYASILQDPKQSKDLNDYKYMLNIVWMRALRQGNWKNWLEALRITTEDNNEKFELRVGVSGVATLPTGQRCNNTQALQLEDTNGIALSVPAYIWAHVRSLQSAGTEFDEFVLVGHNSPYANVFELSEFCDDICSQIPWLNNSRFGELHLLPKFGVVHCCRMDQVEKLTDIRFDKHHEKLVQQQPQQQDLLSAEVTNTTPLPLPVFYNN